MTVFLSREFERILVPLQGHHVVRRSMPVRKTMAA